ncbi:MAG: hypothetical protein GY856_14540 [bacterium]|nr:hypothetical protein [bacterium]
MAAIRTIRIRGQIALGKPGPRTPVGGGGPATLVRPQGTLLAEYGGREISTAEGPHPQHAKRWSISGALVMC